LTSTLAIALASGGGGCICICLVAFVFFRYKRHQDYLWFDTESQDLDESPMTYRSVEEEAAAKKKRAQAASAKAKVPLSTSFTSTMHFTNDKQAAEKRRQQDIRRSAGATLKGPEPIDLSHAAGSRTHPRHRSTSTDSVDSTQLSDEE
jgi:hypothetical protein